MANALAVPCPYCKGAGTITVIHHVTREMALDACDPLLEGMEIVDSTPCSRCGGTGAIEESDSQNRENADS